MTRHTTSTLCACEGGAIFLCDCARCAARTRKHNNDVRAARGEYDTVVRRAKKDGHTYADAPDRADHRVEIKFGDMIVARIGHEDAYHYMCVVETLPQGFRVIHLQNPCGAKEQLLSFDLLKKAYTLVTVWDPEKGEWRGYWSAEIPGGGLHGDYYTRMPWEVGELGSYPGSVSQKVHDYFIVPMTIGGGALISLGLIMLTGGIAIAPVVGFGLLGGGAGAATLGTTAAVTFSNEPDSIANCPLCWKPSPYSTARIVANAWRLLETDDGSYNVRKKNCEHFCYQIYFGQPKSYQVLKYMLASHLAQSK